MNGQREPWVTAGTSRPTAMANAAAPTPVRHQASQVRSAASQVRRDTSVASGGPASCSGGTPSSYAHDQRLWLADVDHADCLGVTLAFELECADAPAHGAGRETVEDPFGDDDLPALRGGLKPGRGVDHVAQGGEVLDLAGADVADERAADIKPDAELQPRRLGGVVADGAQEIRGIADHRAFPTVVQQCR